MLDEENFLRVIDNLLSKRDTLGNPLEVLEIRAKSGGLSFGKAFTQKSLTIDTRSISKMITTLTLGATIKEGVVELSLDTVVGPLLRDLLPSNLDIPSSWDRVTVANMLSSTIGQEAGFFFRTDLADIKSEDLSTYLFSKPLIHEPGTHFAYSNVGTFLISVILQEITKESLSTLANRLLLEPLRIGSRDWISYSDYTAGCTGLYLSAQDMLIIADEMLNQRIFLNTLPQGWINEMHKSRSGLLEAKQSPLPKIGYGLSLWLTPNNQYFCNGTDGQYLIMDSNNNLAIAITSHQPDASGILECLTPIL